MKLTEALFCERILKEFTLGNDNKQTKVVFQSLSGGDMKEIDREVFLNFPNASYEVRLMQYRIPTLCRSIVSISGTPISNLDEVASLLKTNKDMKIHEAVAKVMNENFDNEMLTILYSLYLEFETENRIQKGKLKDFSKAQKDVSSGT